MATTPDARSTRRVVFVWLWALAVVLHLLYLAGSYAAFSSFTFEHVVYVALGAAAVALLCVPRSMTLLAITCALAPVAAWLEAPRLGNHWLLVTIVALGFLVAMGIGAVRRPRDVVGAFDGDGLPTARLVLLVAYGFAALSKFNSSFADPTVSCANVFLDQVSRSVGISGLHASSGDGWTHVVPFVVMAVETSVVVLLALAPTRVLGVIVALAFHGIISIDTEHAFSDFTSAIAALVVLFLPDDVFAELGARLARPMVRHAARAAGALVALASAVLLVWQSTDSTHRSWRTIGHGREAMWWIVGATVLVLVVVVAVRRRSLRADVTLLPADRWFLAWPGLAVLIGLGPWLGLRNATSWNMYANLVTSRGGTNAWFSPGTLRLLHEPDDLVRIIASDDPAIAHYATTGEFVPFVNLRLYTSSHPDTSVTYEGDGTSTERDGTMTVVEHTRDDPVLGRVPEWWWQKVLTYRSVDGEGPASCQDTMGSLR